MGGLVTTPSPIFYNDGFVEEEDITNTEETLGSTLALAKECNRDNLPPQYYINLHKKTKKIAQFSMNCALYYSF